MIPFDAMFMAAEALAGASIPTQWHLSLGSAMGSTPRACARAGFSSPRRSRTEGVKRTASAEPEAGGDARRSLCARSSFSKA